MKVMRTDRKTIAEPQNDVEDVMEEGTGLDEAKEAAPKRPIKSVLLPSHKIVNSKKNRNVTFNDLSTKGTTNVKVVKPGETEDLKVDNTNAIEEHNREVEVSRAEIAKTEMKKLLSRAQNSLKVVLTKIKNEREEHLKIMAFHTAKSQEHEIEIEQQTLRTKVAQESDAVSRNKYSQLKKTYHNLGKDHKKANETIKGFKSVMNSMERAANQQKATISGLKTHT